MYASQPSMFDASAENQFAETTNAALAMFALALVAYLGLDLALRAYRRHMTALNALARDRRMHDFAMR